MVSLAALWMPIVVSAVIVFIASSVMHMFLKYHQSDYRRMPEEETVLGALRGSNLQPGTYMFPHCEHKTMNTPESQEKFKRGPVGMITIMPSGVPAMPKYLAQWFVYSLLISFFAAYIASRTLMPGVHYLSVFRVVGTVAFMSYGLAHISSGIWKGQRWGVVAKELIDGLVYALLTAGTFGWLWPR
ncbi:MAG TPA: hypothetical protein VMZ25_04175 [Terriglobales bacterium]|nr:hypothetical protein [Terriglobales bacterium]